MAHTLITQKTNWTSLASADYEKSSIASYMNSDFITLPEHLTALKARRYFLGKLTTQEIPAWLFITNEHHHLKGMLSVKSLLNCDNPETPVSAIMNCADITVSPDDERNLIAPIIIAEQPEVVPVVQNKRLIGVLDKKALCELVEDENTADAQRQGASIPLEKPYLETSAWSLWRKRAPWLMMLFVAEAYTGNVLKAFEEQLESVIALAFFIPLLIGTGGNSGTQITSTLVRALALGEVSLKNVAAVIRKEVTTSLLIAMTIGLAAWIRAWMMGVGHEVTIVVSLTLIAITIWGAIVSSIIPMLLKKINIDPAVVSAPFIATFIDGTGLIIYFKIAQYVLNI